MLKAHILLKTQKNEVFRILQESCLEPANFSWVRKTVPTTSRIAPRLNYLDSNYYFWFDMFENKHCCTFSPGEEKIVQWARPESWQNQIHYVRVWIRCLKREIEAPDLWHEMEKYKTSVSLALPEQFLNEPIPSYEAEQIADKLRLLADKIGQQFQLTDEQNHFVRSKLNYLADAAKRQRSADWVHTSIGVSITIMLGLALAPDRAKELWQLIESLLRGFIHLIGS